MFHTAGVSAITLIKKIDISVNNSALSFSSSIFVCLLYPNIGLHNTQPSISLKIYLGFGQK